MSSKPLEKLVSHSAGRFQRTRWSLVKRAAYKSAHETSALDEFCRIYWYPLYAAARRFGQSPEDACDAVQTLFAGLIAGDLLRRATPERGRLRSWLLTMLQNQIRDRNRAARAEKRGGGRLPFLLDAAHAEAALLAAPLLHHDPQLAWRKNLAAALLDEAVEALGRSYEDTGKGALFAALLPALEGPLPETTYEETAAKLGTTGGALRMAVVRLRERFRKCLRVKAAVALGVDDGPELDAELRDLFAAAP